MAINLSGDTKFVRELLERLGLEAHGTRRIVIDCPHDGPIMIYVEMFGTTEVLDFEPPDVSECKVQVLECE